MKHVNTYSSSCENSNGFSLVLKGSTAMAVLSLALVGALAPDFAHSGVTWGQGLVALIGGSLGAYLASHR